MTEALVAPTQVILAENQRKKKALADTKSQASRVADENKALLAQLEFTQSENYAVTEHLRKELLAKTQRVAELEDQLQRVGGGRACRRTCTRLQCTSVQRSVCSNVRQAAGG